MDIYIVIYKDHTFSLLSQPPLWRNRLVGSHCFSCSSLLNIEVLRNFIVSAVSYIAAGNIQFVTIEGFTLVY